MITSDLDQLVWTDPSLPRTTPQIWRKRQTGQEYAVLNGRVIGPVAPAPQDLNRLIYSRYTQTQRARAMRALENKNHDY